MERAPRQETAELREDAKAPAATPRALDGPAAVLFLQSTAGNAAVARSLLQREGAAPGVDHGADAENVTITFILRDFNVPKSGDASSVDFLHEPGVKVQVPPGQAGKPVVQAAIAAMNAHIGRHGKDLLELSVGPTASAGAEGPAVGVELEAEFHVTATCSITASSSVEASTAEVDWSPMSIGVLHKVGGGKAPPPEKGQDGAYYESISPGKNVISWVASQLDPSEFKPAGASDPLDVKWLVKDLFEAMSAGKDKREVSLNVDLGVQPEPAGLTRGLARAGTLIANARPDLAGVQTVRLAILKIPAGGNGLSSPERWKQLAIGGERTAAAPPAAPPQRTWGTGPPATDGAAPAPAASGAASLGGSRVVRAPPPLRGVPKDAPAAPAPRTWGVNPPAPS